jgi:hypothetical protein
VGTKELLQRLDKVEWAILNTPTDDGLNGPVYAATKMHIFLMHGWVWVRDGKFETDSGSMRSSQGMVNDTVAIWNEALEHAGLSLSGLNEALEFVRVVKELSQNGGINE